MKVHTVMIQYLFVSEYLIIQLRARKCMKTQIRYASLEIINTINSFAIPLTKMSTKPLAMIWCRMRPRL